MELSMLLHPMTGLCNLKNSQLTLSCNGWGWFLLLVHAWSEIIKHARWMQLKESMTDLKCGIGISSILDMVFWYLPIIGMVLLYWLASPLLLCLSPKTASDLWFEVFNKALFQLHMYPCTYKLTIFLIFKALLLKHFSKKAFR